MILNRVSKTWSLCQTPICTICILFWRVYKKIGVLSKVNTPICAICGPFWRGASNNNLHNRRWRRESPICAIYIRFWRVYNKFGAFSKVLDPNLRYLRSVLKGCFEGKGESQICAICSQFWRVYNKFGALSTVWDSNLRYLRFFLKGWFELGINHCEGESQICAFCGWF